MPRLSISGKARKPVATIICSDCGETRKGAPSNTRYCGECRLLRNAVFFSSRVQTCSRTECKNTVAPLHRSDGLCGHCSFSAHRGECKWCGNPDGELVRAGLPVCWVCAKEPAKRAPFIEALRNRQERRRTANHANTTARRHLAAV